MRLNKVSPNLISNPGKLWCWWQRFIPVKDCISWKNLHWWQPFIRLMHRIWLLGPFRVLTDDISTRRLNEQYSSTSNHNRSQLQHFTISDLRIEWTWYKVHEGFSAQKLFCNAEFLSNMHHHQNLNQSHDIAKMVDFQENHTIYIIKYTSTYLP